MAILSFVPFVIQASILGSVNHPCFHLEGSVQNSYQHSEQTLLTFVSFSDFVLELMVQNIFVLVLKVIKLKYELLLIFQESWVH